jgi:arsenite-transporting ATPase
VAVTGSPLLRQRALNEVEQIDVVATRPARRYAVVPLLAEEPVGVEWLLELVEGEVRERERA